MTTATGLSINLQVNAALDEIQRARAEAMRPSTAERFVQLAKLASSEAAWWEAVSEHSCTRVQWRAALMAREHALWAARYWRGRDAELRVSKSISPSLLEREVG